MRSCIRSALLLVLLCAIVIEALTLLGPVLAWAAHRAYPQIGLDDQGRVVCYDVDYERGPNGQARVVYSLDESRNEPEVLRLGPDKAMARLTLYSPHFFGSYSIVGFDHPRFMRELEVREYRRPSPLETLASTLNAIEGQRRLLPDTMWTASGEQRKLPVEWTVEDNRLVCRETASGRVAAGLGPDGYALDENAAEGERFGRIEVAPFHVTGNVAQPSDAVSHFLFDREARKLHVISIAKEGNLAPDSAEPVTLTMETRSLHPLEAGEGWSARPYASVADRHVILFLADGSVIADFDLEPGEAMHGLSNTTPLLSEGGWSHSPQRQHTPDAAVGMQTSLLLEGPPDSEHRRLRLFRPGEPAIVRDVVIEPTRPSEVFLTNLTAALALLRPPPLNLASTLSARAKERWWWRDPWLAQGSYPGWVTLSLVLAALLAWRARKGARERCATTRAVRFWTVAVFLLGPVGFLWMRLVLPRVPVEPVGSSKRAVNLDASPSTNDPWPDPKPMGIEVFQ